MAGPDGDLGVPDRPMWRRTDAQRNRERILHERRVERDPRATMLDIAAAARVGRSTLYRQLPTERDLEATDATQEGLRVNPDRRYPSQTGVSPDERRLRAAIA